MNEQSLKTAMEEAERFRLAARVAISALKAPGGWAGGKETASARRASMDLTRALADVRRAG